MKKILLKLLFFKVCSIFAREPLFITLMKNKTKNLRHEIVRGLRCEWGAWPVSMCLFLLPLTPSVAFAAEASPAWPSTLSVQQQKGVGGVVVDENGEPLVGVTVVLQGTKTRAVTNSSGRFTINAKPGQTLVFNYIGYSRAEVKATGADMRVQLKANDKTLNEAVVIGYGTVRKADLAGSVAVMDSKQFKDEPLTRIEDALQGRVSGVEVMQSGVPGGDLKIRIRGVSSINKSNDPLYVVDGIVRESGLDGINPEDIQSMQVLKDASSTAIYGARGANGVVLITTKQGRSSGTQVVFDATVGFAKAYNMPEAMSTRDYAQALVDYKGIDPTQLTGYLNGTKPGVDWLDEVLQTGVTQNYKLAISKGDETTQYYVSGNYMQHEGVIKNTKFERYSAKMNVHSKLFSWLEMTADVNLSQGMGKGAGFNQNQWNPIWIALNYSPTMEVFTENGSYSLDPYNCIQRSPLAYLDGTQNDRQKTSASGHIDLKFNIAPGLTFTTTNGVDYSDRKAYSFSSSKAMGASSMSNSDVYRLLLQSTNNLTYTHQWGGHGLTATGVWEATSSERRNMSINGDNLANEGVGYWDVQNAATRNAANGYSKWTLLSGVARVMYNYSDRYMLTATLRADGSSRFSNKKWGYFPSVAAAWTVTQEEFMKNVKLLSNLKIRASYGVIGNQDIDPYSTLGTMSSMAFNYGTGSMFTGYWSNNPATPDLTWEKVKQFDLGIDLGFWDNRIGLTIDYYSKKTTDALLRKTAPDYQGGPTYWVNAGEVSNKGLDVSVSARIFQTRDFGWTTTLNGSYIQNEVTKLTAEDPILYGPSPSQGTVDPCTIIKEGEAIGTFYGYRWAGLQKQADGTYVDGYYDKDGNVTLNPTGDDRFVIGCANPDFTLGWNNSLRYKNWEMNVFFNAAFGAQRLNLVRFAMNSQVGASMFVTDADYLGLVGKEMPTLGASNKNYGNSTKWLENADYFRCQNLSIAYNLPRSAVKGICDLRFSFSVQNLFTITGYKGNDPAGASFSSSHVDVNNGLDMGSYPNPRTFTFGVRMTF